MSTEAERETAGDLLTDTIAAFIAQETGYPEPTVMQVDQARELCDLILDALRSAPSDQVAQALGWEHVGSLQEGTGWFHADPQCGYLNCRPVFAPPLGEKKKEGK